MPSHHFRLWPSIMVGKENVQINLTLDKESIYIGTSGVAWHKIHTRDRRGLSRFMDEVILQNNGYNLTHRKQNLLESWYEVSCSCGCILTSCHLEKSMLDDGDYLQRIVSFPRI